MLPVIPKPPLTKSQKRAALAVAGVIDILQIALFPTLLPGYAIDTVLDFVAAVILTAICGFKWQFMVAFALELFPVVDIFPTWTLFVLTLPSHADASQNVSASPVSQPRHMIDADAIVVPPVRTTSQQPPR